MEQDDVNDVVAAKQWNSWILQVGGTANHVTWFDHDAFQEIGAEVTYDQALYALPATALTDGVVLSLEGIVHCPVNEGCCYTWNGTAFVKELKKKCDLSSVKLTNLATDAWVVGMTQVNMPICADTLPPPAPAPAAPEQPAGGGGAKPAKAAVDGPNVIVYQPTKTIYVTVGDTYKAASVVTDLTPWTGPFVITTPKSAFEYDSDTKKWAVPTSK
eukprot:gene16051-18329_t